MCKELKNSEHIKYLWETSGNFKIRRGSRTAVMMVLHQGGLEIEFPDFNFNLISAFNPFILYFFRCVSTFFLTFSFCN